MSTTAKGLLAFCIVAVMAVALVAAVPGIVWLSGSTFGQRCRAAGYDSAALERCIERARQGGPIYEENIGRIAHD